MIKIIIKSWGTKQRLGPSPNHFTKIERYLSLNCCFSWSNSVSNWWINFVTSAWNSGWQPRNAALWRIGSLRVRRSVSISCKASIFAVKFMAECVSQKEVMTPLGSWEAFVTEAGEEALPEAKPFNKGRKASISKTKIDRLDNSHQTGLKKQNRESNTVQIIGKPAFENSIK